MPIRPKYSLDETRPLATRQFTDREEFIKTFQTAIQDDKPKEQCVLMYYGVGGIGKTSLRKELVRLLEEKKNGKVWALLDFEIPSFREQETALFTLRKFLKEKYKISFPTFDLAYALYWKKTRPQIPMTKENFPLLEGEGVIADMMRIIGSLSGVSMITLIPIFSRLITKGQKAIKNWWTKRGQNELDKLPKLEPKEISERLPMYWAADLNDYLESKDTSAVLFIDSYEALWEGIRSEAKVFKQDEWVRELVSQLPEVLWVFCGREKLRWQEFDANWSKYLKQHLVDGLSEDDAWRFLQSCGITDITINKIIIEGSKGVPYYLDLAVDTYFEIKYRYDREPVAADFAQKTKDVLNRFLRNLDRTEIETLKVLSITRFWDYSLFEQLVSEFKTGYPITAYSELCRFSFINQGEIPETWIMHQLMRESLKENLDPNLAKSIHRFLFNHYNQTLKDIGIKNITDQHKNALTEAFYHGKFYRAESEFSNWFMKVADIFKQAAQWKLLVPLYEEIIGILERKLGPEHLALATALNDLGSLYWSQGKYTEAEPIFQRALTIREKALGSEHPDVAAILNNLAVLFWNQGKYPEAESFHKRTIAIKEKTLSPDHPELAQSLNNLANLYRDQGKYKDAEMLYKRALEIRKKSLGHEHPDTAQSLNNLAILYRAQGKYAEAEPLYKQALEIFEKIYNPDHPDVAVTLNNLGLIYWSQRRFVEAESLHKRALAIREKTCGSDHPDFAVSLNNLANIYREQKKYKEAQILYEQAKQIFERVLGPDHPNVGVILSNLAICIQGLGKYDEAELLYQQSQQILEKKLGPDHPNIALILHCRANLYRDQEKYNEAEPIYGQALKIWEKARISDHPDLAELLDDMTKFYRKIKKDEKLKELEERAKQIRSKKG